MATRPSLYKFPNELLSQIAKNLDHDSKSDLLNLALVSTVLHPIAENAIYRCITASRNPARPHDNRMVYLLRTLLVRPDLADKVKILHFAAVRRSFLKHYEEDGFDFRSLREQSLVKLKELGHGQGDPWYKMIEASIESAFGGLLLALVPGLMDLDIMVYDHHRGDICYEPILALCGSPSPVNAIVSTIQNIERLSIPGQHFPMLALDFRHLTTLALGQLSTKQMCRLNGPDSLPGAAKVKKLMVKPAIQLAEAVSTKHLGLRFGDLLAAMGCKNLTHLSVEFWNEGCRCPEGHEFEMCSVLEELQGLSSTLVELDFTYDPEDDLDDQVWMLENAKSVVKFTPKHFPALRRLAIPHDFIFGREEHDELTAIDLLPTSIRELEIISPLPEVINSLFRIVINYRQDFQNLNRVVLHCQHNASASFFMEKEASEWSHLKSGGIDGFVHDLETDEWHAMEGQHSGDDDDDDDEDSHDGCKKGLICDDEDADIPGVCYKCGERCGQPQNYTNENSEEDDDDDSEEPAIDTVDEI